jgi:hypothetical protein
MIVYGGCNEKLKIHGVNSNRIVVCRGKNNYKKKKKKNLKFILNVFTSDPLCFNYCMLLFFG